jgi:hypothetical protein
MQNENDRVPPPWGDDMEKALITQGEEIQKNTISVPRRRWLSWSIYFFAGAHADHGDSPGLVLTYVCNAALVRGWAQGYPKRLGSIR